MYVQMIVTEMLLGQESLSESIGNPAIVLGTMGLIFGLGLAFAARKLAVSRDPLVEKINAFCQAQTAVDAVFPVACSSRKPSLRAKPR